MEHTDDPKIALEITLDHLSEQPDYYTVKDTPENSAQYNAANDVEEKPKSQEEIEVDEILGFKPRNVGDYVGQLKENSDTLDLKRAELAYLKDPEMNNKLKKFENLYANWKSLNAEQKNEAWTLYKDLNLYKFDKQC